MQQWMEGDEGGRKTRRRGRAGGVVWQAWGGKGARMVGRVAVGVRVVKNAEAVVTVVESGIDGR